VDCQRLSPLFHRKSLTISVPATNSIADSTQHLAFCSSAVQIPESRAARTRPTAQSQWLMAAFHQRSLEVVKPFRTLTVPECCPAGPTLGLFGGFLLDEVPTNSIQFVDPSKAASAGHSNYLLPLSFSSLLTIATHDDSRKGGREQLANSS